MNNGAKNKKGLENEISELKIIALITDESEVLMNQDISKM